jgi:hypothetical protein
MAKKAENKTYVMTDDTYVNIFLSRDFKEKRSSYGLRFFQHKPSNTFITYDPKGMQTRVIITTDESGEESLYEGDSIREVKQALDNVGIMQTKEGIELSQELEKDIDIDLDKELEKAIKDKKEEVKIGNTTMKVEQIKINNRTFNLGTINL